MGDATMRRMTKDQALAHYGGSQTLLAQTLGLDQSTVAKWPSVPVLRQLQLEALTNGALKAGPECDPFRVPKRRKETM